MTSNQSFILVILGYMLCVFSFLTLPIIFMPIAVIIGIILFFNDRPMNGFYIALLAVIFGCIGAAMGGWGLGLPKLIMH